MSRDPFVYSADVRQRMASAPCTCPACVTAEMLQAVQQILAAWSRNPTNKG
jgi:hypothetical protein